MIWALSLAYTKLCPRVLTGIHSARVFGVCLVNLPIRARQTTQCSTPLTTVHRCAKTHFGENQLLPSSISFSLPTTTHPMALRDQLVRASTFLSKSFTLVMVSSPGFGSYPNCTTNTLCWNFQFSILQFSINDLILKCLKHFKL